MKVKLSLLIFGGALCCSTANAQMMLQKAVIASGGGVSSGLILKSNITVGQAVVGTASNATQKAQIGFWTTASSQPSQGVSDVATALELSIQTWPNPASKDCKVSVNSQASEIDIRLFDLTGKEVKAIYSGPSSTTSHSFNVADLGAGSYIIAARAPGQLVEKLISVVK